MYAIQMQNGLYVGAAGLVRETAVATRFRSYAEAFNARRHFPGGRVVEI